MILCNESLTLISFLNKELFKNEIKVNSVSDNCLQVANSCLKVASSCLKVTAVVSKLQAVVRGQCRASCMVPKVLPILFEKFLYKM